MKTSKWILDDLSEADKIEACVRSKLMVAVCDYMKNNSATEADIAKLLNVPVETIELWENFEGDITVESLAKVTALTGVSFSLNKSSEVTAA